MKFKMKSVLLGDDRAIRADKMTIFTILPDQTIMNRLWRIGKCGNSSDCICIQKMYVDNQELNEKWRWKISELSRRKYTSVLNTSLKITTCTIPAVELTLESGKLFVGKILEISTQSFDKSDSGSTAHTIDNLWRVFGLGDVSTIWVSLVLTHKRHH